MILLLGLITSIVSNIAFLVYSRHRVAGQPWAPLSLLLFVVGTTLHLLMFLGLRYIPSFLVSDSGIQAWGAAILLILSNVLHFSLLPSESKGPVTDTPVQKPSDENPTSEDYGEREDDGTTEVYSSK